MRQVFGRIAEPRSGVTVGTRIDIKGTLSARNLTGHYFWIVHRRVRGGLMWPKEPPVRPDADGAFSVTVAEGGAQGRLIISLLAIDEIANGRFEAWVTRGLRTNGLPGLTDSGELEIDAVDVLFDPAVANAPSRACVHEDTPVSVRHFEHAGARVFLGHGRSLAWRELKDFLADRLKLPWDEFNREPVAGVSTQARLKTMLREANFAFLILTAEDEAIDGRTTARANVVHEAGLFQARLGFERAIVLLEEGCEQFSNIVGLTHISFPRGQIRACFEEVRRVLEREGVLSR
jgi:hypothetical protein